MGRPTVRRNLDKTSFGTKGKSCNNSMSGDATDDDDDDDDDADASSLFDNDNDDADDDER